jgi:hypothetical protein
MKLCICGSRNLKEDFDLEYLHSIITTRFTNITEIISGGAKGADKIGEAYAAQYKIKLSKFLPNYSKYPAKVAPLRRNETMAYECDYILCLWNGTSRGSKYMCDFARKLGKQVEIIILDDSYFKQEKQYIGSASHKKEVAELESLI